jgi:hypothetical protein
MPNTMKRFAIIVVLLTSFFIFSQPAYAFDKVAGHSAGLKEEVLGIERPDPRIEKLEAFLAKHDSPLASYSQEFIEAADLYQLDWKLVTAITGVESSFGKRIPTYSYNAYGWANGHYYFPSWEQSINHISQCLKEKYLDRGLDTPYKIGPVYAPPSPSWAYKVVYFMNQIESFENESCLEELI